MATIAQAVRMALHYGETNLGVTDIFGEDVGPPLGGIFTATQGLRLLGTPHSMNEELLELRWESPMPVAAPSQRFSSATTRLTRSTC